MQASRVCLFAFCLRDPNSVECVQVRRRTGCSRGEPEPALAYYRERMSALDEAAEAEYDAIVDKRQTCRNRSVIRPVNLNPSSDQMNVTGPPTQRGEQELKYFRPRFVFLLGNSTRSQTLAHSDLYKLFIPSKLRKLVANEETEFFTGTGVVEFTSLAEKQCAIQSNLSGQPYFILASNAPDPRDLLWCNISMDRKTIEQRRVVVQVILVVGLLGWGAVVTFITNLGKCRRPCVSFLCTALSPLLPDTHDRKLAANNLVRQIENNDFFREYASVLYGYLPATMISLILLYLPYIFLGLGKRVIRFKSLSRVDEFTLLWNTCYR